MLLTIILYQTTANTSSPHLQRKFLRMGLMVLRDLFPQATMINIYVVNLKLCDLVDTTKGE